MYSKAIQKSKNSIFPIIATHYNNGRYVDMQVAGTGFFIDDNGTFVTALHVVNGNPTLVKYGSLGNIPHFLFKNAIPEEIVEVGRIPEIDLFVGKLAIHIQTQLEILDRNPPEGTSIIIGGYPFPNIKKSNDGNLNFFTVRQYWQSTMIMDYLNLSNFNPQMPYNGFLVDKRTIAGMSGGPALNMEGNVAGMCTAQITRTAKDKIPNINGVCLDAKSLKDGIAVILNKKN